MESPKFWAILELIVHEVIANGTRIFKDKSFLVEIKVLRKF